MDNKGYTELDKALQLVQVPTLQNWIVPRHSHDVTNHYRVGLVHPQAPRPQERLDDINLGLAAQVKPGAPRRIRRWCTLKREWLAELRQASDQAVVMVTDETLAKVRTLIANTYLSGSAAWRWFDGKPTWLVHFYRQIAIIACDRLPGYAPAQSLAAAVEELAILAKAASGN